jgi:PAS domain S-box-containing protein
MDSQASTAPSGSYFKLYLSGTIGIVVFIGFLLARVLEEPGRFSLAFNPFAIASAIAIILTVSILGLALKQGTRSEANTWFAMYTLAALIGAIGEFFMRSSADAVGAIFWGQILGLGMAMAPVGMFLFVLAYTQGTALRHTFVAPMLILTGTLVAFMYGNNGLIFSISLDDVFRSVTHLATPTGPWFALDLAWIFSLFAIAITILFRFYKTTHNPLLKSQAFYFFWVFTIPFGAGAVIDGVLPLAGVHDWPNVAVFVNAVTAVLVYRGARAYHLLQVDPTILSQNILRTMREAVVVAGSDLRLQFVNQEAETLLGVSAGNNERTLDTLFPKDTWTKIEDHLRNGTPLGAEIGQLNAVLSDGRTIPVQVSASTIVEGSDYQAYIVVLSDIRQITASYKTIESIVEQRTKELQEAQDRLKAEDRLKREFIALSSHNLGTPLSIMQGSVQLIKTTEDPGQREQLLRMLENGIKRLAEFVDEMSAISTLESGGQLDARPITVTSIVEPLIEETAAFSSAKRIAFKTQLHNADVVVNGNQLWLRSCIRNLLDNALKFTEKGTITLTTKVTGNFAQISIADTGIGIEKGELPLLFTKFHRGTDFERYDYDGEGLGLYLTKLIVEQHGGRIQVKSELGKGSSFTVFLPLHKPRFGKQ